MRVLAMGLGDDVPRAEIEPPGQLWYERRFDPAYNHLAHSRCLHSVDRNDQVRPLPVLEPLGRPADTHEQGKISAS